MNGAQSAKTQRITKRQVWEAWLLVKRGGKSVGIDGISMQAIAGNPRKYLYPLWNRRARGRYQPPAVRQVCIPKGNGGIRKLGIPTILDRVAQKVITVELEKVLELTGILAVARFHFALSTFISFRHGTIPARRIRYRNGVPLRRGGIRLWVQVLTSYKAGYSLNSRMRQCRYVPREPKQRKE